MSFTTTQGQLPSMLRWAGSTTQNISSNIQLSEIAVQKEVVVFGDDSAESSRVDRKHTQMSA